MSVVALIGQIFKPAADLIDNLHTSGEERAQIESAMFEVKMNAALQVLDYEKRLLESQTSIVKAEAQGGSWLQRSWRPITMLTFLALVILNSFGLLATELAPEMWNLLQIGLGGYVVGRSGEKIMQQYTKVKE